MAKKKRPTAAPYDVALVKATICEYPFADIKKFDIDIRQSRAMPKSMSERLRAFPLFIFGDIATVGMEDPLDLQAIDERCSVRPVTLFARSAPKGLRQ